MKRVSRNASLSIILTVLVLFSFTTIRAQSSHNDVNFFLNYHTDVNIASRPYGEGFFARTQYCHSNYNDFGLRTGYPITERMEVQGDIYHSSYSHDDGYDRCGLADFFLYGRHQCMTFENTVVGGGAYVSLPIGSEDMGYNYFNYGAYGAARHKLSEKVTLAANAGVKRYQTTVWEMKGDQLYEWEKKKLYETAFHVGGGTIVSVRDKLTALAEILAYFHKKKIIGAALGGDYGITSNVHLRGSAGVLHNYSESHTAFWTNVGLFQFGVRVTF